MIVMINGAFGVGKTTVANLLRKAFTRSALYDPEWAGLALRRLPKRIKLRGSHTDDFQDIYLWRKSAVAGIRLFRLFARGPVIVPMTFSCRAYFDEVVMGVRRFHPELRIFCLHASVSTIKKRLFARGDKIKGPDAEWTTRRLIECAEAHRDAHFGEPVDTEGRSAREVTEDIVSRLQQPKLH